MRYYIRWTNIENGETGLCTDGTYNGDEPRVMCWDGRESAEALCAHYNRIYTQTRYSVEEHHDPAV